MRVNDQYRILFRFEGADAFEAMEAFGELMERIEHDFARAK